MALQLDGALLDLLSADPASPVEGQLWYNTTDKALRVVRNGLTRTIENRKCTVTTSAPSAINDTTQAYEVGSRWINTATQIEYVAVNVSSGAAVWLPTTTGNETLAQTYQKSTNSTDSTMVIDGSRGPVATRFDGVGTETFTANLNDWTALSVVNASATGEQNSPLLRLGGQASGERCDTFLQTRVVSGQPQFFVSSRVGNNPDLATYNDLLSVRPSAVGTVRIGGTDLQVSGAASGNVLAFDGTKFAPSASTSGISSAQHQALRQLIHFIDQGPTNGFASGAYKVTTGGAFPSSIVWWESSALLKKIVEKLITWTAAFPTTIQWNMYDTDGTTVLATVTDTITYSGAFESTRSRAIA